jgi:cyclic pyranopterin phosphate synthase
VLDRLGRPLEDLRISVTDRCNLRCRYCMPREVFGAGYRFLAREQLLSFEEVERVAAVAASLGVRKLRLTGGEPLLRRDLERLVEMLVRVSGVQEVAMTTNGLLLARHARALARAGLTRVTVSLDALDDQTLARVADAPISAGRVIAGIDAALAAGLEPVKVNMVVRRGLNDRCVAAMAQRFRGGPVALRFIEYMDVGSSNGWREEEMVPAERIRREIDSRWPLQALPRGRAGDVASRYRYRDGAGEVGFVHSVSKPFCDRCVRARLSADGKLYTCLFARRGHDLRALLRGGASDGELSERMRAIWRSRADRYSAERSQAPREIAREAARGAEQREAKVEMSYIGG